MALEPGQIIDGKYKVGRLIGEGGMGTVYEGENSRIGRRVAIKVLHAQVAALPEFIERFEREARAAARIGSPHVCDVLDLGDLPGGDRYIVMEFLDGVSFEERIEARGTMTPAELAPIAFELLEGLGTMHGARVIHRDLKPANVFLAKTRAGRGEIVKILDFGVAKLLPFEGEIGTMTRTGSMMGTPLYMSPEQARGARDVDARTDLYAASVMFYRALTGVLPYSAETLNELLFKIVLEDPRPLREVAPDVDETFAAIVHKGLARDVEQRFASARAYQTEIAAWGKAQGRTSLQFAVTLRSEPPPPFRAPSPSSPEAPVRGDGPGASRAADGTPVAWSERGGSSPDHGMAPVTPAQSGKTSSSSGRGAAASAVAASSSGEPAGASGDAEMTSTGPSASAAEAKASGGPADPAAAPPTPAHATTAPSAEDLARAGAAATAKSTAMAHSRAAGAAGSRRGVIVAGVAGVAALVGAAIVFTGRHAPGNGGAAGLVGGESSPSVTASAAGPATDPPTNATTSATASAAPSTAASPDAGGAPVTASSPTTMPPTTATTATAGPTTASTAGPTTATATPAPGPRRDPNKTAATAAATGSAGAGPTTAASAIATATAAPGTTAKPAGSARKFRTNLD